MESHTPCVNHRQKSATSFVFNRKVLKDGSSVTPVGMYGTGLVCADCKSVWDEKGYDAYNEFRLGN